MTQLRLAEYSDLPQVSRIMLDGWRTTYAGVFPDEYLASLTYESVQRKWESFLQDPEHFICVACEGEKVLAFIAANCAVADPAFGFIESFHSLPEARGKGLGRSLVEAAHSRFRNAGKEFAMVYAIAENKRAQAIYTHLGAEIREYFTDHFDGITTNSVKLVWKL